MLARTETGVVVARKGDHFTILLKVGNRIKVDIKHSPLQRGSKCHVCFNNATGKVVNVLTYDENSCDMNTMEYEDVNDDITEKEIDLIDDVEEGEAEGSRRQKCEDWEHSELEFWSSGVFSETEV